MRMRRSDFVQKSHDRSIEWWGNWGQQLFKRQTKSSNCLQLGIEAVNRVRVRVSPGNALYKCVVLTIILWPAWVKFCDHHKCRRAAAAEVDALRNNRIVWLFYVVVVAIYVCLQSGNLVQVKGHSSGKEHGDRHDFMRHCLKQLQLLSFS